MFATLGRLRHTHALDSHGQNARLACPTLTSTHKIQICLRLKP